MPVMSTSTPGIFSRRMKSTMGWISKRVAAQSSKDMSKNSGSPIHGFRISAWITGFGHLSGYFLLTMTQPCFSSGLHPVPAFHAMAFRGLHHPCPSLIPAIAHLSVGSVILSVKYAIHLWLVHLNAMDKKIAVVRREHFNAAHRLYRAQWSGGENK